MKVKEFTPFRYGCSMVAVVLGLAIALVGCKIGQPQHIVALSELQDRAGTIKDPDFALHYDVNYTSTEDSGKGVLKVAGSLDPHRRIDAFNIELSFMDADGKVAGRQTIFSSLGSKAPGGYHHRAAGASFNVTVDIPPGTDALGFSIFSHQRPSQAGRGRK